MAVVWNGKVITENRIIGSFIMAISMTIFPLIPIAAMMVFGEIAAYIFPSWYEHGIISSRFLEMWMGGVITLMGLLVAFGRKGSGLSINNGDKRSTP